MNLTVKFEEQNSSFTADFGKTQNVSDGGYDRGYAEGYGVGNTDGYEKGHTEGTAEGYENGLSVGTAEGYGKGHTDGFEDGYAEGYDDGVESVSGEEWYITDARYLFYKKARLSAKDVLLSKLKDVTSMAYMFADCRKDVVDIDTSGWDTSKVTDMASMFYQCQAITTIDTSKWDIGNVISLSYAFYQCPALESVDVSNWNTSNVTDMSYIFKGDSNLIALDTSKWDTKKVTNFNYAFNECAKLRSIDMRSWDTSKASYMQYMFYGCSALEEIVGCSAMNKAGINITFPYGSGSSSRQALKRLTFRTDLSDGVYSIRSAINIKYCSFERDGMVEMFNTLPNVSGLGLTTAQSTITITGNPCVTDGTLTAEDEAIATSKGWTIVK